MDADEAVIRRFWDALSQGDGATMADCYAPDASFEDAVFTLRGHDIGKMWRTLMPGGTDLKVVTSALALERDGDTCIAHGQWEAHYTFRATGRHVRNHITTTIRARDGAIVEHSDDFAFWRWARQALGPVTGGLLGWTPLVRQRVRAQARRMLR